MAEQNNKIKGEEKIKEVTAESIDDLTSALKTSSKKFIDACVSRSVEMLSEVLDKVADKAKEKIRGKDNDDG